MSNDLATSTLIFIYDNIFAIFFVVILLSVLTIYIVVNDITFKEETLKVDKVITIEKFTTDELKLETSEDMRNDGSCDKLKFKDSCTALGSCVWVTAGTSDKKCVSANPNIDSTAPGSDGPEKKCFKKNGKLIPWELYYYLDGNTTKQNPIGISIC